MSAKIDLENGILVIPSGYAAIDLRCVRRIGKEGNYKINIRYRNLGDPHQIIRFDTDKERNNYFEELIRQWRHWQWPDPVRG